MLTFNTKSLIKPLTIALALSLSWGPVVALAQNANEDPASAESIGKVRENAKSEVFNEKGSTRVGSDTTGWVNVPTDFTPLTTYQDQIGDKALQFQRNDEEVVVTLQQLDDYDRSDIADVYKDSSDVELHALEMVYRANAQLGAARVQIQQEDLPFAEKAISVRALYGPGAATAKEVKYYIFTPKDKPNTYYLASVISVVTGEDFIKNQVEPIIKTWSLTK